MKRVWVLLLSLTLLGVLALALLSPVQESSDESSTREAEGASRVSAEPIPSLPVEQGQPAPVRSSEPLEVRVAEDAVAFFDRRAVYGTVRDSSGKAVTGAKVTVRNPEWDLYAPAETPKIKGETHSDERGWFQIGDFEPFRGLQIDAHAEGFAPGTKWVVPGKKQEIELEPAAFLQGEILDAQSKEPIPSAQLSYWHGGKRTETPVDSQGRYKIPLRPRDSNSIQVIAEGYAMQSFAVKVQPAETTTRDVALQRGRELSGEIFDLDTGRPVAGATIRQGEKVLAQSDESGKFRASLSGKTAQTIQFGAEGYCDTYFSPGAEGVSQCRIPLVLGAAIEGKVRDRAGNPVAGARVHAQFVDESDEHAASPLSSFRGSSRFRGQGNPVVERPLPKGMRLGESYALKGTRTDPQGRFQLKGLLPSKSAYAVYARHADYCVGSQGGIHLPEFGEKASTEIVLSRGGRVEGKVTMDGKAFSAKVWLRGPSAHLESESNDAGEFGFRAVPEGAYTIGANPHGVEDWDENALGENVVVEEDGLSRKDISLSPFVSRPIAGHVLSHDGRPVTGARVSVWSEASDGRYVGREAKTLADGSFRVDIPELPGTLFQVSAWDGVTWANEQKVAPGRENLEIRFPATGKLRLHVLDSRNGESVPSYQVFLHDSQGKRVRSLHLITDAHGVAEADLPQGVFDLSIQAAAHGLRNATIPGVTIASRSAEPLRVDLLPGVKVEIRFVKEKGAEDSDGENSRVALHPVVPALRGSTAQMATHPDENGKGVIAGVTPGKYRVVVTPAGGVAEPAEIEIPDEEFFSFEVRWKPAPPPAK